MLEQNHAKRNWLFSIVPADFLRARGISHNVASVELVTHVLHLWNRSQIFFQQLWNWSHFLVPIPQLPRQLWNWSQPKMHLWNRAQKEKKWNFGCDLFQFYYFELWSIPIFPNWIVTYSNIDKLNCDLFQCWHTQLWPIPRLTNWTVTYSNIDKLNCDLFHWCKLNCDQFQCWQI